MESGVYRIYCKIICMSKPHLLLLAILFCLRPVVSSACGNEYYSTLALPLQGGRLHLDYLVKAPGDQQRPYWFAGFGEDIITKRNQLFREITGTTYAVGDAPWTKLEQALGNIDYKLLSDLAWYELRVGSRPNAVRLLERLYEKYPDEYNIVANLGTAYEVTGKDAQALALLKKAVAINPASHHGSEWIHVNILEQKLQANPDYSRIIGLGADQDYPHWLTGKAYDKPVTPDSLMVQLAYQLHERISFVEAPDQLVGRLVMDFADLVAIARSREEAKEFYQYATSYDSTLADAVQQRLTGKPGEKKAEVTAPAAKADTNPPAYTWLYVTIAMLAAILLIGFVMRRKT